MKTFQHLCLPFIAAAFLWTAEKADAQETFAPLLTKDTTLFVHVDAGKVDIDTAKAEAKKLGETLLKTLGFDAQSQRLTLRDLDVELEKWDTLIRPAFELITKELGIQENAWIADDTLLEQGIYFVVAAPWKGKTDADLQKLFSVMPEDEYREAYLPVGGFLFVAFPDFNQFSRGKKLEIEKQILTEWVKNAAADNSSLVLQALKSLPKNDEIKAVVTVPKSLIEEVSRGMGPPENVPIQVRNLLLFTINKMEWAAASVPVSEILSGAETKEWRVTTVKMPSNADAKMLREMIESAVDGIIDAARQEGADAPPLLFEFARGFVRTWLPAVEGDTLIFQWKGSKTDAAFVGSAYGISILSFWYMRMMENGKW